MAKKVLGLVKLALRAGKATPAPPVGPALGQYGVNIVMFCKEYNFKTIDREGLVVPVEVSIYEDRSFSFILKTPPASILLAQAACVLKGASKPKINTVGYISLQQLRDITEIKLQDLNTSSVEKGMKIIMGTAKSMGIQINS